MKRTTKSCLSLLIIALIIFTLNLGVSAGIKDPNNVFEDRAVDFTFDTVVAMIGDDEWTESDMKLDNAKIGDTIEILMYFYNDGKEVQKNVVFSAVLPKELRYIDGSSVLHKPSAPDGKPIDDGVASSTGVRIDNLDLNVQAYLSFRARFIEELDGEISIKTSVKTDSGSLENTNNIKVSQKIDNAIIAILFAAFLAFFAYCFCVDLSKRYWEIHFDKMDEKLNGSIETVESTEESSNTPPPKRKKLKLFWRLLLNMFVSIVFSIVLAVVFYRIIELLQGFIF